jgi:hypothetical protein
MKLKHKFYGVNYLIKKINIYIFGKINPDKIKMLYI